MASKKSTGKPETRKTGSKKAGARQAEDIAPKSLERVYPYLGGDDQPPPYVPPTQTPPPDEEPSLEVIVIGEDSPVDDKPPISNETPEDVESESDIAARESLAVLQEQLAALGYSSVFEVLSDGPDEVLTKIHQFSQPMDNPPTQVFYEQAQARAASLTRFYTQLCSRGEPAMHAVLKLQVAEETSALGRSLSTGGTYNSWFSQGAISGYAHPDSAGSLFSPASYLTDLYRVAKPLHPAGNGLQVNQRRPDLGQLKLSDANLNEEISTLALTLEVLEAGVTGDVDQELLTKVYPMGLPYNHANEQIVQGMAACKSSLAELWSVLGDFEGKALKYEASLTGWVSRMPVNYARDALGMSAQLAGIFTESRNASEANVAKYFGHTSSTNINSELILKQALQLPEETIIEALGGGPFYILSAQAIISAEVYGACYINGWTDDYEVKIKPLYWYVGAALGNPVPKPSNSPTTSNLYKRNGRAFERLNRVIRLQRHIKALTFEELDWLICQSCNDITDHPLTLSLQALAVYMPLRRRYGMTVNSFGACLHLLNTFHGTGKSSFYTSLFGDDDLIDMVSVDFLQSTTNKDSLRARARLCQGLKINDATLIQLAQYLPGIDATSRVLPVLGLEHISALYRLVAIPHLFGLSVAQALALWDLLADTQGIVRALAEPKPNQVALGVLIRTGYLVDWMHAAQLEPEQLVALTSRRYPVQSTPELQVFIENIYSTLTGRPSVESSLQPAVDEILRAQLARHIGAEFNLKANVAAATMVWVDAVAHDMNSTLNGYGLLGFWADIERVCQGESTLDSLPNAVQYAYLLRQFAQVCHWAQLGELDLHLLMPAGTAQPSALTGAVAAPQLTLDVLLLLSRYRSWQRRLHGTVAEGLGFLQRAAAQDPVLTLQTAAQEISELHGWDLTQTLVLMNGAVPRSFVALLPLLQKMQFCQRLGLSPTDLSWVGKLTETAAVDQATLTLIASKIIAAAHG